jgi:hypothetical protein
MTLVTLPTEQLAAELPASLSVWLTSGCFCTSSVLLSELCHSFVMTFYDLIFICHCHLMPRKLRPVGSREYVQLLRHRSYDVTVVQHPQISIPVTFLLFYSVTHAGDGGHQ